MTLKHCLALLPIITSFLCYASPAAPRVKKSPVLIHEFPKPSWCENLAPTCDGKILVTRLDVPELYLIDPSLPSATNAELLATIPGAAGLTGIAAVSDNVYAFAVSKVSLSSGLSPAGAWSIWRADLTKSPPEISKIADVPQVALANGVAHLPAREGTILVADSFAGVIWRFNTWTGALHVAINNTALAVPPKGTLGANGLQVRGEHLYYTNTDVGSFGRVPIDPYTGAAVGPFSILARNISSDDFALGKGAAYLAGGPINEIIKVDLVKGDQVSVFAGNPNSIELENPTSVRFGITPETRDTVFVTTNGGLEKAVNGTLVGGKVLAFQL